MSNAANNSGKSLLFREYPKNKCGVQACSPATWKQKQEDHLLSLASVSLGPILSTGDCQNTKMMNIKIPYINMFIKLKVIVTF